MLNNITVITCSAERQFRLYKFNITPTKHSVFIQDVLKKVQTFGGLKADPSGRLRTDETLSKTRYLGLLSEILLQRHLRKMLGEGYEVDDSGEYTDYKSHVDLKVKRGEKMITIEARGSFPFSNLKRVVCELFDIIGPYSTSYKPGEIAKDFYLRTLINVDIKTFDPWTPHTLYFAGGAERDLLEKIGVDTDFKQENARYRTIKPISHARDCVEIIDLIVEKLK